MNEDDELSDDIMALLPEQASSGWEGINPCEAYHSGYIYLESLNEEESMKVYLSYKETQDILIPDGFIEILSKDSTKKFKCARTAFVLGVVSNLKERDYVI